MTSAATKATSAKRTAVPVAHALPRPIAFPRLGSRLPTVSRIAHSGVLRNAAAPSCRHRNAGFDPTGGSPRRRRESVGRASRQRSLRRVLPAVAADAEIGLLLVAPEALDGAEPAAIFADHDAGLRGFDLLIGAGLEELADPQAAGVAGGALGRQGVVGADYLV